VNDSSQRRTQGNVKENLLAYLKAAGFADKNLDTTKPVPVPDLPRLGGDNNAERRSAGSPRSTPRKKLPFLVEARHGIGIAWMCGSASSGRIESLPRRNAAAIAISSQAGPLGQCMPRQGIRQVLRGGPRRAERAGWGKRREVRGRRCTCGRSLDSVATKWVQVQYCGST
jgi:hypothetical protein